MDTSEIYIKMCEKAEEIQALSPNPEDNNPHSPTQWDRDYVSHFYLPHEKRVEILKWDNDTNQPIIGDYNDDTTDAIWLPHQDQLQEMTKECCLVCQSCDLERFGNSMIDKWDDMNYMPTWEQYWLMYTMAKKYKKFWDGTDWIKQN